MSILIEKFNETYIKIATEPSIARELSDYFTITIPNANWSQHKHWNGKIRLYKARDRTLYKGLIPYVEDFAKNKGYSVGYSDTSLSHGNNLSLFEVEQFSKVLNLPVVPHKHQIDGITHALRNRRLMLVSPTASGKSLMLYIMIRSLLPVALKENKRLLVIVPNTNLVEQMYGDFCDYGWNTAKYCHRIYSGQEKETNHSVVISTWQSLVNFPKEYFKDFLAVFGDEAHLCTAKSLQQIIGSCENAIYRVGTTGTIQDTKSHRLTLEGLFGLIYKPTTTHQLIHEKKLAAFQIKCVLLNHQQPVFPDYREELEYLVSCEPRNKFIRNLAMSLENNTLVLFQFVAKHGVILKEMLDQVNKENIKKIYFIYSKVDAEDREKIRTICEMESNVIIVASYGVFQAGANIKNLHNIIFASPSKSRIRVCQSIGRELRLHDTKETAFLFDIADSLVYNDKVNYTLKHFAERINIYNYERFPWKMYKVELNQ